MLDCNSAVTTAELQSEESDDYVTENWQLQLPNLKDFPVEEFFKIGFTHHTAILS